MTTFARLRAISNANWHYLGGSLEQMNTLSQRYPEVNSLDIAKESTEEQL